MGHRYQCLQRKNGPTQYERQPWHPIRREFLPHAAGLGAEVVVGPDGPGLLMGTLVSAGTMSAEYNRSFPWRPLGPQWDLGVIAASWGDARSTLKNETADWAHNRLVFADREAPEKAFAVTLSRLSPALLMETWTGELRLGLPLTGAGLAFSNGEAVTLAAPGAPISPRGLDRGWLLVYGLMEQDREWPADHKRAVAVHFGSRMAELERSLPKLYRPPLLFVFSQEPAAIETGSALRFRYAASEARVAVMPLYGIRPCEGDFPMGGWQGKLPAQVKQRCDEWAARLGRFPLTVKETYAYDSPSDTVTVNGQVQFVPLRTAGEPWAPLPPVLALAADSGLPVAFSKPPQDARFDTAYGPYRFIAGTDAYSWSVKGLGKYVAPAPALGPSNPRSKPLEAELAAEVDKLLAEPYLAAWEFELMPAVRRSWVYWRMPSETAYYLAQILPALDRARQEKVRDYLRAFHARFPFLEKPSLPVSDGRFGWRDHHANILYDNGTDMPDKVTFAAVRGLADYYAAVGEKPSPEDWKRCADLLAQSLAGCEWATGSWCLDQSPDPVPPKNRGWGKDAEFAPQVVNRQAANLIGFLRLASLAGQEKSDAAALAWGNLARMLALRLALAKYAYWLSPPRGPAPLGPDWVPFGGANEVRFMNQFEVNCWDHAQDWMMTSYIAFLDLTPEMAAFLRDHARREASDFLAAVDRSWPCWWLAHSFSRLGGDLGSGIIQPSNSHSLFIANAWIRDLPASELAARLDVSWTARGDLFYLHKLAETIRAYRGSATNRE